MKNCVSFALTIMWVGAFTCGVVWWGTRHWSGESPSRLLVRFTLIVIAVGIFSKTCRYIIDKNWAQDKYFRPCVEKQLITEGWTPPKGVKK